MNRWKRTTNLGSFFPLMSSLKHFLYWYLISIDGGAALETHLKCPTPWCQTWKWFKFNCRPLLNRTISNPIYFNWRWTNEIMLRNPFLLLRHFTNSFPLYSEIFEELPSSVTMNLIRGLDLGWNWGKLAENWMKLTPDGKFNLVVHSKSYSLTQKENQHKNLF